MALENDNKQIVFANVRQMPMLAVSLADTRYNKTGSWRRLRPAYREREAPCDLSCPNGNGVRRLLALAAEERFDEALTALRQTNPLPGVCGRVCYHPCEASCNRGQYDEPLAVHEIERLVAERGQPQAAAMPTSSGHSIAVIGGGPSGLSCAYHLARLGHFVVLYEAQAQLGGLLRYGIPSYRLPSGVLDREIEPLLTAGEIEVRTGQRYGHDFGAEDLELFDAVFLAAGAQRSRRLALPGEELPGTLTGIALLRAVAEGQQPKLGRQVVVIGGGNSAVDSARVARRLGAEVTVVYRRTREEMPAIAEEVKAAQEEGITCRFQMAPQAIVATEGRVAGIECARTSAGMPEADGRRRFEMTDARETLPADSLVVAIGEEVDGTLMPPWALPASGPRLEQGDSNGPLWLVGGDFAGSRRRVVDAMGDGRRAALAIDSHLRGLPEINVTHPVPVGYGEINKDYFSPERRVTPRQAPSRQRAQDFREVAEGLHPGEAAREASRCFSCGVCTQCDNCWLFCPDIAVQRRGEGYQFDYAYCKGCGVCATECPRSAIEMREEAGA